MKTLLGRLCAFFIAFVLAFVGTVANAAVLFGDGFENNTITPNGSNPLHGYYYGAMNSVNGADNCTKATTNFSNLNDNRIQTEHVRYGSRANAQTIKFYCNYMPLNGGVDQKPRQELKVSKNAMTLVEGQEYYMAFSFKLPDDWVFDHDYNVDSIFQTFKNNNRTTSQSIFDVGIKDDQLYIVVDDTTPEYNANETVIRGQWYDFFVHLKMCTASGCGAAGFIKVYRDGSTTPVFEDTGVNSEGTDASPTINLYKFGWVCDINYRKNLTECYNRPRRTRSEADRTVYFDEFYIANNVAPGGGTYASVEDAMDDIVPFFRTSTPPPDTGVSVIGFNTGNPLTPPDDVVTYTTTGGDTSGVTRIALSDGINSEDAIAIGSNSAGGAFAVGSLSTLNSGPVDLTFYYDSSMQYDSKTGTTIRGWTTDNVSLSDYVPAVYGELTAATIQNTSATYGYANSPTFSVTAGQTVTVNTILAAGNNGKGRVRIWANSGGTNQYYGIGGTLNSFSSFITSTGSGHSFSQFEHGGYYFQTINFTATLTGTYRVQIGPGSNVSGDNVVGGLAQVWVDKNLQTFSHTANLSKPDTVAPGLSECDIAPHETDANSYRLGCIFSELNGTFYAVITNSSTAPSLAQCKAGQDHTSSAALWASNQAATSGTFTATSLDPYVDKYAYFCQTDAAANDSAVVAAETHITGETPVTKSVKFDATNGRLKRGGALFSGTFGNIKIYDELPWKNPAATLLAHAESVTVTSGEVTLTDASLCATNCGSINALEAATDYAFVAYDSDDDPYAFGYIQITVE